LAGRLFIGRAIADDALETSGSKIGKILEPRGSEKSLSEICVGEECTAADSVILSS